MIETPTWVMNAIAPSSAIAGVSPRVQCRVRPRTPVRPSVTPPCWQARQPSISETLG